MALTLTGRQKRRLRALGHHLKVVVQVGGDGVTKGVIGAVSQALKDHELIKVKIDAEKEAREEALVTLVKETGAAVAQTLGKTALLFKARKNKPKIKLDAPEKPEPAKGKGKPPAASGDEDAETAVEAANDDADTDDEDEGDGEPEEDEE